VLQTSEEDKEVPESKVKKELVRFVDSHPETITQKVSIILHHFITSASKKIEGKGRGMVVVRSRKHCVLFHEEMVRQMRQRGLNYSCLVGFSGSIFHNGRENTEESLNSENGLQGNNIPEGLKDPRFRILIVSNKFQTGFDEPLLQSMYVDKKLSGVQCVQTLSRLNRMKSGKTDTFVLDFVNKTEDIVSAFQPYFTSTVLTEETDPDKLYDLLYEIESYNLYTALQVDEFCKVFYSATSNDAAIHPLIDRVVTAFRERLNEEEQEAFKSKIQSFIRLYAYISQIATFAEAKWEKSYVFLRSLNKKLPLKDAERVSVVDYVDLDSLRIQIIGESSLSLMDEQGEVSGISGAGGKSKDMEDKLMLSEIIQRLNEVYGMNLTNEDAVTIGFITERLVSSDDLRKVMNGNNSEEVKMEHFSQVFKEAVIDFHGERIDFYKNVMDPHVLPIVTAHTYRSVLSQWAS
jgi:type I restriction enzyme R subunit